MRGKKALNHVLLPHLLFVFFATSASKMFYTKTYALIEKNYAYEKFASIPKQGGHIGFSESCALKHIF